MVYKKYTLDYTILLSFYNYNVFSWKGDHIMSLFQKLKYIPDNKLIMIFEEELERVGFLQNHHARSDIKVYKKYNKGDLLKIDLELYKQISIEEDGIKLLGFYNRYLTDKKTLQKYLYRKFTSLDEPVRGWINLGWSFEKDQIIACDFSEEPIDNEKGNIYRMDLQFIDRIYVEKPRRGY